jgi:ABC-2 type transport system permease protein
MNNELQAIYFLWKRELIRFFRAKSRIIGSLGMPFFFLAIIGTGLNGVMGAQIDGTNYITFMTPGILSMVILMASIFSGIIVIMDRQFGFLKETLVAPVQRTSIIIGKSLGGATTALIQGVLMLAVAMLLGVTFDWSNMLLAFLVLGIVSLSFVALGIAMGSVMEDMHGFQLVMNFLIMPMFFLSGAIFPLSSAPEAVRIISYFDPLTYSVEALRSLLIGYSAIPLGTSLGVLVGFWVVTTGLAVYLFNKIES